MARPREFHPDRALDKAVQLFWRKGYGETSYDDIVGSTGVSRHSLYGTFGNKKDLYRQALASYIGLLKDAHQQELRSPGAALEQIRSYFETLLSDDRIVRRGCMICNTAFEAAMLDKDIATDVRLYFEDLTAVFSAALTNARDRNELGPEVDPPSAAVQLTGLILSSAVLDRIGFDPARVRGQIEACLSALERR